MHEITDPQLPGREGLLSPCRRPGERRGLALRAAVVAILLGTSLSLGSVRARAQQTQSPPPSQPASTPAAPPSLLPPLAGPLSANPKPMSFDVGPLGPIYVTGVATYLGQYQNNVAPGDHGWDSDLSNGQLFINKPTGLFQYFIQVGAYSLPDLGIPYLRSDTATKAFYGPFSQGFVKIAPTDNFSIEAGKLPTLIGAEYTFSFENMNIERGLLWNQENAVNRGVQINYSTGPLALAVSWNDGLYSNHLNWAWFSGTWTIDKSNTLAFIASGATSHETVSTVATPVYLNNEQLYNLIYTHTSGQWTIQPYLQYTHVPRIAEIGALEAASTYGGALLVNYSFPADAKAGGLKLAGLSVPVRLEYIASTGSLANGAPNLMYGPGSKAWSVTVTPTYQYNVFFARMEFSFVGTSSATPGLVFGPNGTDKSQTRVLLETGIMF